MTANTWTPLIVAVAPNGARRGKADHPALPVAAPELAATAAACREAGAALIHLHVRDRDGGHLLDANAYRAAIDAVRRAAGSGLIVQVTSEAAGKYGAAEQMAVMRALRPEAMSLSIREIVPDESAEPAAAEFLAWAWRERIMVQYILYDAPEVGRFADLVRRGLVPGTRHFAIFVLGRYSAGQQSDPASLLPFLEAPDRPALWAVCAFGAREAACTLAAAALGGHGRVGFENNLRLADGRLAPDNAALVAQLVSGAALIGRPAATPEQARALLAVV